MLIFAVGMKDVSLTRIDTSECPAIFTDGRGKSNHESLELFLTTDCMDFTDALFV